jgi:hypothetical protein
MPWNRNDPDPLELRRRQLAEQERHLAEQRRLLAEQLQESVTPSDIRKAVEPPVWRREDDHHIERVAEPTPARKRNLARQRQRDMFLFFIFIIVFLIVMSILLWLAYVHNTSPAATAA